MVGTFTRDESTGSPEKLAGAAMDRLSRPTMCKMMPTSARGTETSPSYPICVSVRGSEGVLGFWGFHEIYEELRLGLEHGNSLSGRRNSRRSVLLRLARSLFER